MPNELPFINALTSSLVLAGQPGPTPGPPIVMQSPYYKNVQIYTLGVIFPNCRTGGQCCASTKLRLILTQDNSADPVTGFLPADQPLTLHLYMPGPDATAYDGLWLTSPGSYLSINIKQICNFPVPTGLPTPPFSSLPGNTMSIWETVDDPIRGSVGCDCKGGMSGYPLRAWCMQPFNMLWAAYTAAAADSTALGIFTWISLAPPLQPTTPPPKLGGTNVACCTDTIGTGISKRVACSESGAAQLGKPGNFGINGSAKNQTFCSSSLPNVGYGWNTSCGSPGDPQCTDGKGGSWGSTCNKDGPGQGNNQYTCNISNWNPTSSADAPASGSEVPGRGCVCNGYGNCIGGVCDCTTNMGRPEARLQF